MEQFNEHQKNTYSWHQSHDQATVLLVVPYDTVEEDVIVVIERNYLLAGVRGQQPVVKGRLYGNVDTINSAWQLEPRTSRLSARERTTSTVSTASTQSSYAFVSDPEISSSFAASLESGQVSDSEEAVTPSPALSSPISSSADERTGYVAVQRRQVFASRPPSPRMSTQMLSSFSSLDSLHSHTGRLLTLHLEKDQSVIWPSLIIGPVPITLSPCVSNPMFSSEVESKYNMDPTSLVLIAIEHLDIRKDKEEAFEYFVRAWHQACVSSATMKLVTHYLPLQISLDLIDKDEEQQPGTLAYYVQCIGGAAGLAKLFHQAGLLYLEGAASILLSASYSTLSSIRLPSFSASGEGNADAWRRDREAAGRYFDRARALDPTFEIPIISIEDDVPLPRDPHELEMPSIEVHHSAPPSVYSGDDSIASEAGSVLRRRRSKKEDLMYLDDMKGKNDMDNAWYLYIPGLVGAGTALLVVGVVGALSFSSWRRNQGS